MNNEPNTPPRQRPPDTLPARRPARRLWRHVIVSVIAAGPAGGFLFGLLHAGDPDSNPIGRFVYACMMAGLTPWHAGFPPASSPGLRYNVWPYILVSGVLLFGWLVYRDRRKERQRSR